MRIGAATLPLFMLSALTFAQTPASSQPGSPREKRADGTTMELRDAVNAQTADDSHPCAADVDSPKVHDVKEVSGGGLIHKVAPKYPRSARKAHIEGTVVLCAVIQKNGVIRDLRAISGPPELVPAAMEAVKKWRYRPYVFQGQTIEVSTDIRVNFQLTP